MSRTWSGALQCRRYLRSAEPSHALSLAGISRSPICKTTSWPACSATSCSIWPTRSRGCRERLNRFRHLLSGYSSSKPVNDANLRFAKDIQDAKAHNDSTRAFFVSPDKSFVNPTPRSPHPMPLATSSRNAASSSTPRRSDFRTGKHPDERNVLSNQECLEEPRSFFKYANLKGYRGSPHKL
jgi:hypothetical protein